MLVINHSKYRTPEREINLQISVTLKMKNLWNGIYTEVDVEFEMHDRVISFPYSIDLEYLCQTPCGACSLEGTGTAEHLGLINHPTFVRDEQLWGKRPPSSRHDI